MRFPDILKVIKDGLQEDNREPDNLLHCSKHIWWPLRFSQLEFDQKHYMMEPEFLDKVNMLTGTLHHTWIQEHLKKAKNTWWELVATEVDLTEYLPAGWTGTADWVFYDKEADHCIVGDYKTIKPEAVAYLYGIKPDHLAQLSCYNLGLTKAGYTMAPEVFVFYLPKNKLWTHEVKPQQLSSPPLGGIETTMNRIRDNVFAYVNGMRELAPMPEPEIKTTWNSKMDVFDVREVPHWMETYTCPFDANICPRTSSRKIGQWTLKREWQTKYGIKPIGHPTEAMYKRRSDGPIQSIQPVLQSI